MGDGAEPGLLHEYFARTVRAHARRSAVHVPATSERPAEHCTYAELDRRSKALARALSRRVASECIVAILLPRTSSRLYAAQLAVLRSGAAYTCLDPAFPDEHIAFVLRDAAAVAIVTDGAGRARAHAWNLPALDVLDLDRRDADDRAEAAELEPAPAPRWLTPRSLAYVIYTSGSTGRPKGVMIEHRSICNLVAADLETFGLTPDDRVAQGSSPAYDSSLEETWLALAAGATVVVMDDDSARLGPDLVPWLRRERITVLCPPPTLLRTTGCRDPEAELPDLRLLYVGGEALPQDLADLWARGRWLENGYGPTECTVTVVRGRIRPEQPIVIGRPVRGHAAFVVDEDLREVADGSAGELCIAGIGLARGYLNLPELTAERFLEHPLEGRIYKTGDLARRDANGDLHYLGRIDAQVKLRGYRIELTAVEAQLAACPGVRAAASRLQGEGASAELVAFVVPERIDAPPMLDHLRALLRQQLPAYMVPSRVGLLSSLPTTVGGKLDRARLPLLQAHGAASANAADPPRDALERRVVGAMQRALALESAPGIHADFFLDLGGHSLGAVGVISTLREDVTTAAATVRDLYQLRTAARLADRLRERAADPPVAAPPSAAPARSNAVSERRIWPVTLAQAAVLGVGVVASSALFVGIGLDALPAILGHMGWPLFLCSLPLLALLAATVHAAATLALAVLLKRLLIGRYRAMRAPMWSGFHLRHWVVQHAARLVPWGLLQGTELANVALRALGARIGRRVHIARGVDLRSGGWDLLTIGDDVTVGRDAALRLVELCAGDIVIGPVTLESGSTLDVRASVGAHSTVGPGAFLAALSWLPPQSVIPAGERFDGVPATPAGKARTPPPESGALPPLLLAALTILARFGTLGVLAAPAVGLLALFAPSEGAEGMARLDRIDDSATVWRALPALAIAVILAVPATLLAQALFLRLVGRVRPGTYSLLGWQSLRITLKLGVVESAGEWLSGTLMWPHWLRLAGMKVGRDCEISTIIDVLPENVAIGGESFLADGIYLGGPRACRGTLTVERTLLGRGTFLGNHVIVPSGQQLADGLFVGVCTVTDESTAHDTGWFGHPAFELPKRQIVHADRSLTHDPSLVRRANRWFWETLRFALVVPSLVWVLGWYRLTRSLSGDDPTWSATILAASVATLAMAGAATMFVLLLKWSLLGRVKAGQHALWSCWCSRWDFLYVAWGFHARGLLSLLEGSSFLTWYLRAMGAHIGRGVVLGDGFAQVVDPDMLHFEDGATVNALFQAHSFEDRVLKIGPVHIRRGADVGGGAVVFYGTDIGAGARVAPHSVVMKQERLLPGRDYAGCPAQPTTNATWPSS